MNAKPQTKWRRVLRYLAEGHRLTRFQAVRILHDWTLNSTVCDIQRRGIRVDRELIKQPGYAGSVVRCARYWLAPDQRKTAGELLAKGRPNE